MVPNSSFQSVITCPSSIADLQAVSNWYNPTVATPDFFHQCNGSVPLNPYGYQPDHSAGGAYFGLVAFTIGSGCIGCREYIQVELTDSLHAGSKYCIEYYVSLFEFSGRAISDMGAYLSDSAIYLTTPLNFPVSPSIENADTIYLADTMNWMPVSGIYTANGGEKFLTIGNFRDNALTHVQVVDSSGVSLAYYLIDDVSIINCDSIAGFNEISNTNAISLYPNPSTDIITITSKQNILSIDFLNMLGCTVLKNYSNQTKTVMDIGKLNKGIYFAQIKTANGITVKKFVKQ